MNISMGMDRLAGMVFILIGAGFFWLGIDFGFGSMLRIGPGFFPLILSGLLIVLGLVIVAMSFRTDEAVNVPALGPMVRVLLGMALFAGLMQPLGSYFILPVVVVVVASASPKFSWKAALSLALGITVCSDLIFRIGLGLPLPAIGSWWGG
jgi:hypothetical protein